MSKCCVSGCPNSRGKMKGVPMFHFPNKIDVRNKWIKEVGIDPDTIGDNTKICRLHFSDDDLFHFPTKTKLKPGRVPRIDRAPPPPSAHNNGDEDDEELLLENVQSPNHQQNANVRPEEKGLTLIQKQHVHPESPFLIENFKHRDKKILHYTGLPQYRTLMTIFKCVYSKSEHGPTQQTPHKKWGKLTPLNEFFLTLMRLRRGFDHETLADMFGICSATVDRIFATWINLLHVNLTNCNIFPHRDELVKEARPGFLQKYPDVIGSIGCVEVNIEAASTLIRPSQCVSQYKDAVTLKSLIMINATGGIIFVSALQTESVSDKNILEDSGFLDLLKQKTTRGELQAGDVILADEGVNVENLIEDVSSDLTIPTFRITGMQYQPDETKYVRTIARERAHVEKAIFRLKSFKILSQKIPISLLGNVNQIFTVCALLTNFR